MADTQNGEQQAPAKEKKVKAPIAKFDKFLIAVTRKGNIDDNGMMKGVTISVNIRELQRSNMPNSQEIIDKLNATNDHQNPLGNSHPMIIWYFPAGKVKSGETYKANDIHGTYESADEETGDTVVKKSKVIIGMKIHLDKKIVGQDEKGKFIFE